MLGSTLLTFITTFLLLPQYRYPAQVVLSTERWKGLAWTWAHWGLRFQERTKSCQVGDTIEELALGIVNTWNKAECKKTNKQIAVSTSSFPFLFYFLFSIKSLLLLLPPLSPHLLLISFSPSSISWYFKSIFFTYPFFSLPIFSKIICLTFWVA